MSDEAATTRKSFLTPFNVVAGIIIILGLIVTVTRLSQVVKDLKSVFEEMKTGVTWGGECKAIHREINRRLSKLEE